MITDEPLIYTANGNVPVASLTYLHEWQDTPDAIKFIERYKDAKGIVVKESIHIYLKQPLQSTGLQGVF